LTIERSGLEFGMSTVELKARIEGWDSEERGFAAAYLRHLSRKDSLSNQMELESGMREFDQGKSFTLDQADRLHEALKAEGK
jgi:hypothetical protein